MRADRVFWEGARSGSGRRPRRSCLGRLSLKIRMTGRAGRSLVAMMIGLSLLIAFLTGIVAE